MFPIASSTCVVDSQPLERFCGIPVMEHDFLRTVEPRPHRFGGEVFPTLPFSVSPGFRIELQKRVV